MQIVIEIPDGVYKRLSNSNPSYADYFSIYYAIKNGTPLPKGHGRLIDADALLKKHPEFDTYPFPSTTIDNAPPIIEADKEYEVEVITRGKCMMCEKELTEGLFFCKECVDKANKRK